MARAKVKVRIRVLLSGGAKSTAKVTARVICRAVLDYGDFKGPVKGKRFYC